MSSSLPNLGLPQIPDATRRVTVALGLILILAIAACFVVPPAYRKHKVSRAHKAIADVSAHMAAGNIEKAGLRIRLALSLAPEDAGVQRATAKFCHALGIPEALQYWQLLMESGRANRADRTDYVRSLIAMDRPEQARALLVELLREDLHDFDCLELSLQTLLLERRTRDALIAAKTMVEQFPKEDIGLLRLGQTLLSQREAPLQNEGQTILWGLALRDNPYLLPAIEALTRQTSLTPAELRLLERRIPSHHTNQLAVGLLRIELSIRLNTNQPPSEVARKALATLPPNAALPERMNVADWLYERGFYEEGLGLIPASATKTNLAALQRRLQGLGNLNRWPEAASIVEDRSMPLPAVLRDLYRAVIASKTGTSNEVAAHLASAAAGTQRDPSFANLVAGYAEAFDQPTIAAEALQNLMADPGRVARTGARLLKILDRVDDIKPILEALNRLLQVSPDDARLKNERTWWRVVTGQMIDESRAAAEELIKEHPADLKYLATLTLAHFRQGNSDLALQTIETPFLESTNPPIRARFAYVAALGGAGQREAARRAAKPLADVNLRSAERILITNWLDVAPNP